MDINEFINQVKPKPRSKIEPFYEDLKKLKEANCTIEQLQKFVKLNGLSVSKSAIDQYMKRKQNKSVSQINEKTSRPALEDTKKPMTKKEDSDRYAENLTNTYTNNPVINKLKDRS